MWQILYILLMIHLTYFSILIWDAWTVKMKRTPDCRSQRKCDWNYFSRFINRKENRRQNSGWKLLNGRAPKHDSMLWESDFLLHLSETHFLTVIHFNILAQYFDACFSGFGFCLISNEYHFNFFPVSNWEWDQ